MLDTIRVRFAEPVPLASSLPVGWTWRHSSVVRGGGHGQEITEGVMLHRERDALRMGGGGSKVEWAEVSLPRVAGRASGKNQLGSQKEIDEAMYFLSQGVKEVAPEARIARVLRGDIAWQWRSPSVRQDLSVMAYLRHPRVRRPVTWYAGESVHWPGEDLHIRVYDAQKELHRRAGDVLRLEAQCRGEWAQRIQFPLRLPQLWSLLREVAKPLAGVVPGGHAERPRVGDLLAVVASQGVLFPGSSVPIARWYLDAQTRATHFRLRKAMQDSRYLAAAWSLDQVMPAEPPPAERWVNIAA